MALHQAAFNVDPEFIAESWCFHNAMVLWTVNLSSEPRLKYV